MCLVVEFTIEGTTYRSCLWFKSLSEALKEYDQSFLVDPEKDIIVPFVNDIIICKEVS